MLIIGMSTPQPLALGGTDGSALFETNPCGSLLLLFPPHNLRVHLNFHLPLTHPWTTTMPSKRRIPKPPNLPPAGTIAPPQSRSTKRPTPPSLPQPPPAARPPATALAETNPQLAAAVTADRYRRLSSALDPFLPSFTQLFLDRQGAGLESKDWLVVWAKLHEAAWLGMGLEDLARMGDGEFSEMMRRLRVREEWLVGLRGCIMGYVGRMVGERVEAGEEY